MDYDPFKLSEEVTIKKEERIVNGYSKGKLKGTMKEKK